VAGGKVSGTVFAAAARARAGRSRYGSYGIYRLKERGMIDSGATVTEDYAVVARSRHGAAPAIAFEFAIPEEGPVSYSGRLFDVCGKSSSALMRRPRGSTWRRASLRGRAAAGRPRRPNAIQTI
jgi:hypothetical protein